MAVSLTSEEKAKLQREDSLILDLPGANGVESAAFHDPNTGREFPRLPVDAYHLTRYLKRGLRMGPASAELKATWLAGAEDRKAADDASVHKYKESDQYQVDQEDRNGQSNEVIAAVVLQVLAKLGVKVPSEPQAPQEEEEEETKIEYDVQLPLFVSADAPPEREIKHEVSQASRPDLHLVG